MKKEGTEEIRHLEGITALIGECRHRDLCRISCCPDFPPSLLAPYHASSRATKLKQLHGESRWGQAKVHLTDAFCFLLPFCFESRRTHPFAMFHTSRKKLHYKILSKAKNPFFFTFAQLSHTHSPRHPSASTWTLISTTRPEELLPVSEESISCMPSLAGIVIADRCRLSFISLFFASVATKFTSYLQTPTYRPYQCGIAKVGGMRVPAHDHSVPVVRK